MTKVSWIAIEPKSSRGTFSSIAIELKIDGQRALNLIASLFGSADNFIFSYNGLHFACLIQGLIYCHIITEIYISTYAGSIYRKYLVNGEKRYIQIREESSKDHKHNTQLTATTRDLRGHDCSGISTFKIGEK